MSPIWVTSAEAAGRVAGAGYAVARWRPPAVASRRGRGGATYVPISVDKAPHPRAAGVQCPQFGLRPPKAARARAARGDRAHGGADQTCARERRPSAKCRAAWGRQDATPSPSPNPAGALKPQAKSERDGPTKQSERGRAPVLARLLPPERRACGRRRRGFRRASRCQFAATAPHGGIEVGRRAARVPAGAA
jgi:hypothetical protein